MKKADVINTVTRAEYLLFDKERGFLCVFDKEMMEEHGMNKLLRVYRVKDPEGDTVEELDLGQIVDDLIEADLL
jgi:hypothetical protein